MAGGIIGNLMFAVGFKFNSKGMDKANKGVEVLTAGVVNLGISAKTAIAAMGMASIAAASNYENAMLDIQGATGATAEQMEETRGIAQNLYGDNFGENWDDLGKSISTVASVTGETGQELENTTRNALLLRDTFGFEVAESVKSVDTMMRQFGITSEEAMNLLANGAQKGLDKSGELMDSANEYANQFKSLGFTAEEMFDVFAAGSSEGVFQLDKVGDAVKEFNIRSKDMSQGSMDAFESLGLNAEAMMQTFANGGPESKKAFSQIVQMIGDIEDPIQRNAIGVALMGTQFEDLEVSVVKAMGSATSQFDMTSGAMEDLNKIKFQKPMQAFRMFMRQLEVGILIPIGQKLLPALNLFGQWMSEHKPQIAAVGHAIGAGIGFAIEQVQRFIVAAMPYFQQIASEGQRVFGIVIAAANDLWISIEPIMTLVGTLLLQAFQWLWPEIQNLYTQITAIVSAFVGWEGFGPLVWGIGAAFVAYRGYVAAATIAMRLHALWIGRAAIASKIMTVATRLLSIAMSLNPVGLVIAAIVGLVAAFVLAYKKSETFRNIVNGVWAAIKKGWTATANFFTKTIPAVFGKIVSFAKEWWPLMLGIFLGPFGLLIGLVIKNWDKVKEITMNVLGAVKDWIVGLWSDISTSVSGALDGLKAIIANAWDFVLTNIQEIGTKLQNIMVGVWDGIKDAFIGGINWVIDKLNGVIEMANGISIKNPFNGETIGIDIPTIPTIVDGSHANGLAKVPYNGYIAELHKDERVLTASENKAYNAGDTAYTPESTPAKRGSAQSSKHEVTVKLDFSGQAPNGLDDAMLQKIREVLGNEFESAIRRMGLGVG
ncbi:phage tail tape measure protein [Paenibacillus sp. strain BS8-2]